MFYQLSGHPLAQLRWYTKVTVIYVYTTFSLSIHLLMPFGSFQAFGFVNDAAFEHGCWFFIFSIDGRSYFNTLSLSPKSLVLGHQNNMVNVVKEEPKPSGTRRIEVLIQWLASWSTMRRVNRAFLGSLRSIYCSLSGDVFCRNNFVPLW